MLGNFPKILLSNGKLSLSGIPLGHLHPPYFDLNSPAGLNYGFIGHTIGHEMTHGYDRKGAEYDAHGRRHNWWTDSDRSEFHELAQCFVKQYSAVVEPITGMNVSLLMLVS